MERNITVDQIMSTDLITLQPEDSMDRAQEIFKKHNIHHIPVIDEDRNLLGILSKSDLLKVSHGWSLFRNRRRDEYDEALYKSLLVNEVMTNNVIMLGPNDTVHFAASVFKENLFHALPVADDEGRILGIVTPYDLLNYCFKKSHIVDESSL